MISLHKNTIAELMALSAAGKLEAAEWLKEEARERLHKIPEAGESGPCAADLTAILEAMRKLDRTSQSLSIDQIQRETAANSK